MDDLAIARVLAEIGDLLEIKAENPFKIRAYRNTSETIVHTAERIAELSPADRLGLSGIGKDINAKITELLETGQIAYHQALLEEFPPTILDLLNLQGIGPKTVALLYRERGIRTLEDLEQAARDGTLRTLKGMGAKKETWILKALEERTRVAGRRLIAEAHDTAAALVSALRAHAPDADITPVGSLRRGCETCGDLDILAAGGPSSLMEAFTSYHQVERVLAHGETKSSVLLRGGFQADLRMVPRESLGAALQYFTGSKPHNIALRDRALKRGLKLNEYGLYRNDDGVAIAGPSEESIYATLGLAFIRQSYARTAARSKPPSVEIFPRLITHADLLGDLHMHTTATDGRADAEAMAVAARAAGLRYIAITDHSQALAMANGLDETRALAHARHIRELDARLDGITVLAGIECDIRADGTLDLAHDCLAQLDIVIASVHSAFNQEEAQMTDRILRAIECPWVDVLGHPSGRMILKRDGYRMNFDLITQSAEASGLALEINSQPHRLDLDEHHARLARDRGVKLMIDSDAHSPAALGLLRWGATVARRAWLTPGDVLNTLPLDQLKLQLRRARAQGSR